MKWSNKISNCKQNEDNLLKVNIETTKENSQEKNSDQVVFFNEIKKQTIK